MPNTAAVIQKWLSLLSANKMNTMKIRKYTESDKIQLLSLWAEAFPNNPKHSQPLANLEAKLKVDDLIFVAEHQNEVVGVCMAGYDGHRGWLYAVAVSSKHRRLGIGKALVEYAIDSLQQLGCIKINLQVRESNDTVVQFYRSLGFNIEPIISLGKRLV